MTSAAAATEPLAVQVMHAVLNSRLPAAPDQRQAIEDALAVHECLCVRVAVGHSECEARCTRSAPVELWSVRVEEEGRAEGPPPLPALFLLNAVRSYVHFSQLSAWLRPQEGDDPPPAAASYQLLLPGGAAAAAAAALAAPPDAVVAEHCFPLAADSSSPRVPRRLVRVSVRFVQRARPLCPSGLCLQLGRLPTDEWLLPSPLPSPTGHEALEALSPAVVEAAEVAAAADYQLMRGTKHKASEPPLYSPTGPALKQAHFGGEEEKEELVIEHVRDDCIREDTVVEEEERRCIEMVVEERKEEPFDSVKRKEEEERRVRREMLMEKMKRTEQTVVKKERSNRGGLRRMIGGWEECVLAGGADERPLPLAGYTLTIVSPSSPPVRLRLSTSSLSETRASCVARATVSEESRVRDGTQQTANRKMIRRRGLAVHEQGTLQMSLLNGEGTAMQLLTVPYDVREMPSGASTMIRHRVRLVPKSAGSCSDKSSLRYLVQMSMARDRSGRCFVTGEITVVFSTDASVDGDNIEMNAVTGVAQAADRYVLRAETITAPFSLKTNLVVV